MGQTFVFNSGSPEVAPNGLQLQFGMFFDGTLNNMRNTELRQRYLLPKKKRCDLQGHEINNLDIQTDDDDGTIILKEDMKREALNEEDAAYNAIGRKKTTEAKEYLKYLQASHRTFADRQGTGNSFSNDYTNVARQYKCCERKKYAIYIEGIGTGLGANDQIKDPTDDIVEDSTHGSAFGAGKTGIRGKVRKGCMALAEKIKKIKDQKENKKTKLTEITIDVFGFSRGAAAARNFVYEVAVKEPETPVAKKEVTGYRNSPSFGNDSVVPTYEDILVDGDRQKVDPAVLVAGKMPIRGLLGYYLRQKKILSPEELEGMWLTIRFLGLYDTVSSYEETYDDGAVFGENIVKSLSEGVTGHNIFADDVEQLHLNDITGRKIVHFTAKDEHRKNFALTRITAGTEKNFPGVHSDIGGGYLSATEKKLEIETSTHFPSGGLEQYRQNLIDEYWYKDEQIKIISDYNKSPVLLNGITPPMMQNILSYRWLQGTRYLKKEYSYIPLQFMETFFRTTLGKDIASDKMPIFCSDQYPIGEHNLVLKEAYKILHEYVFEGGTEWYFIPDHILHPFDTNTKEAPGPISPQIKQDHTYAIQAEQEILTRAGVLPKRDIEIDKDGNEVTVIEEVKLKPADDQTILRRLRNEYLHWSSSRKWVGMKPNRGNDPNDNGKRDKYPKTL